LLKERQTVSVYNIRSQESVDYKSKKQKQRRDEKQIRVNRMSQLISFIQVEIFRETS
jgi:hypothetical protein